MQNMPIKTVGIHLWQTDEIPEVYLATTMRFLSWPSVVREVFLLKCKTQ